MKKFSKVKSPEELDFYSIYLNEDGEKEIQIHGYTYYGDHWIFSDIGWFTQRLEDFVNDMKEDSDYINNCYSEAKQYEEDLSSRRMVNLINSYFDGEKPDYYLQFSDITMETPCGNYANQVLMS